MAGKKSSGNASNKVRANRCRFAISTRLERAIDTERRKLSKAQSILGCLAVALETPLMQDQNHLDYGQVAEAVRELLESSIERLDSVNLSKSL